VTVAAPEWLPDVAPAASLSDLDAERAMHEAAPDAADLPTLSPWRVEASRLPYMKRFIASTELVRSDMRVSAGARSDGSGFWWLVFDDEENVIAQSDEPLPTLEAAQIAADAAALAHYRVLDAVTAADLAHQHLVRLADALKSIGQDSYTVTSERLLALLVEAGYPKTTITLDGPSYDKAQGTVEGVRFYAFGETRSAS